MATEDSIAARRSHHHTEGFKNSVPQRRVPLHLGAMSRILFATLGSLGDLHPLIAIGLELRRRGHKVGFCTSETYRSKLEGLGFGFDPLRPDATPENAS